MPIKIGEKHIKVLERIKPSFLCFLGNSRATAESLINKRFTLLTIGSGMCDQQDRLFSSGYRFMELEDTFHCFQHTFFLNRIQIRLNRFCQSGNLIKIFSPYKLCS